MRNIFAESCEVEVANPIFLAYILDKVKGTKQTSSVRRKRLLPARICRCNCLAVPEVICIVDTVNEQHSWLCPIPSRSHDLIPQGTRLYCVVDLSSPP